jgi:lipopolysaccharide/colanic/teichoic acid biosynthesis glycosyltransferase
MRLGGDRGPFLHRAIRNGENGRPFTLLKVRTMTVDGGGSRLTGPDDRRITRLGRPVRRLRLDELPQLVNVLRGEMSLVGPRPEDPAYVDFANPLHQRVFRARPGITGLAQLEFHDEAALLGGAEPERTYREVILPAKLRIDADYLDRQSVRLDLEIMLRTVGAVIGRDGDSPAAGRAVSVAGDADQPSDGGGGGGAGGPSVAAAEEASTVEG